MPREEKASEEADTLPAEDDRLVAALHRATQLNLRHLLSALTLSIAQLILSTKPFNPHFKQHYLFCQGSTLDQAPEVKVDHDGLNGQHLED